MKIDEIYSFRFGLEIVQNVPALSNLWEEILACIDSISDDDLIKRHKKIQEKENTKSLSKSINQLMDEKLINYKWIPQSEIFATAEFGFSKKSDSAWTLDFSKSAILETGEKTGIAVEVAFNHGEAAAWNLVKPVLAAEINDIRVKTHIGEGIGVVIVASPQLKKYGAFDGAIGDFVRYKKTLNAMRSQLTTPIILIGLAAPETFKIQANNQKNSPYKSGEVVPF